MAGDSAVQNDLRARSCFHDRDSAVCGGPLATGPPCPDAEQNLLDAEGLAPVRIHQNGHQILLSRFEPAGPVVGHGSAVERSTVRREPGQLP